MCDALQDIEDIHKFRLMGFHEFLIHRVLENLKQKCKAGSQQLKVLGSLVERVQSDLEL